MNGTKILVNFFFYGDAVNRTIKISLIFLNITFGIHGLIANSLILYFIHIKRKANNRQAFNRSVIVDRFIQSLALSYTLCCAISLPIYVNEIFTNAINTNVTCKVSRYVMFLFPAVTVMNYLLIGIERYLGVFHPLKLPRTAVYKKCIMAAWVLGGLITGFPIPTYVIQRYDLNNATYTCICDYNTSNRLLFSLFVLLGYIIPSIILMTTCYFICKFIRRRKVSVFGHGNNFTVSANSNSSSTRLRILSSRYQATNMFMKLILVFVIPYIVFTVYSCVIILIKLRVSLNLHYIIRMVSATFVFGNTAIGSAVMFYNSRYLKRKLFCLFEAMLCMQT